MSRNKRKMIRVNNSNEDDSHLKHQRSSLRVNLSCASNLTDSGNGSLRQMNVGCNADATSNTAFECNGSWKGSKSRCLKNKEEYVDDKRTVHHGITLKNLSVVLERIGNTENLLNKSCEKLKHAILTKTKQMFEKENEFSIKTCTILGATNIQQDPRIVNENFVRAMNKDRISPVSCAINKSMGNTSTDESTSRSIKKHKQQNKLKKRRLFNVTNTIHDNDASNPLLHSLGEIPVGRMQNHNTNCSVIHQGDSSSSISCISEEGSMFTAVPVCCSTMISEETDKEDKILPKSTDDLFFLGKCTEINTVSMEITDVHGGMDLNDKQESSEHAVKNRIENCLQQTCSAQPCSAQPSLQTNRNDCGTLHECSINCSYKTRGSTKCMQQLAEHSANTVGTSLDVNTSVDIMNERNGSHGERVQRNWEGKNCHAIVESKQQRDPTSSSEKEQESVSLRMNTSLDTSYRVQLQESVRSINMIDENTSSKENNTDTTGTCRIEDTRGNKDSIIGNAMDKDRPTGQHKRKFMNKIEVEGQSYIEATPYPMSRSVLLKSQLKQNANNFQTNKCELKDCDERNHSKSCFQEHNGSTACVRPCNRQEEIVNNTIILNDSSSVEMSGTKSQASIIIQDSSNEIKLEKDQSERNSVTFVTKKTSKKKLLPLRESSQLLTFSPVEEKRLLPERSTCAKTYKKRQRNCVKNKVDVRNDKNNVKHVSIETSKQIPLENDLNMFYDRKKDKKPKKVISKKIVVKKIVNQDILKRLEVGGNSLRQVQVDACILNRSSSNDFQSMRRSSNVQQLSRRKAHRINIVTTGLSNEDKSIVKSVVKAVGQAKIESNVTKRTTHVVTTGVRTINLLHGIIRGCWLVSLEWVLKSLESNAWLNPEEFEMTHFSKAVLENRKDRQLFGSSYVPELFATCGCIYIEKDTRPPCNVLKDLVKTAGGRITENTEAARIVIGAEGLKETWILDCITTGDLQPFSQYQRH